MRSLLKVSAVLKLLRKEGINLHALDSEKTLESNQTRSLFTKYLTKFKGHKRITPLVSPAPIDIHFLKICNK